MKDVSLLTGNLQPKGHPFFVDEKTIDGAAALLADKALVAHVTHEGAEKDRIGKEAGFFKGIYRDGLQLRAKAFDFLQSFKDNSKAVYDNLAEIARDFPEQFGVSLNMKYRPVWVLEDGSEVPAKVVDGKLAESAPAKAVRALPSARVTAIHSGDFVTSPAANLSGLLCGLLAEVDTERFSMATKEKETPATFDQATLDTKLSEQKQALTAELNTAHQTALDSIKAELTAANTAKGEAVAALASRDTAITAALSEAGVKVEKLDGASIKTALTAKIESEAQTLLASRGMKPLPETITKPEAKDLKTDEQIEAAYLSMKPGSAESVAFVETHREALWRIQSGGKK